MYNGDKSKLHKKRMISLIFFAETVLSKIYFSDQPSIIVYSFAILAI